MLHAVVREQLETFLAEAKVRGGADAESDDASAEVARPPPKYVRPRHLAWAELRRRVFEIPPSPKLRWAG